MLERRELVGGGAVTEEIHPGFRCSTLAHSTAPFFPQVAKDLDLAKHGLEVVTPEVRVLALAPDAAPLCIYNDTNDAGRTVNEIEKVSAKDAQSYPGIRAKLLAHRQDAARRCSQ